MFKYSSSGGMESYRNMEGVLLPEQSKFQRKTVLFFELYLEEQVGVYQAMEEWSGKGRS